MDAIIKRLMENHRVLNEMAKNWKEIEKELVGDLTRESQEPHGGSRRVLEHLIKLYYWSDSDPDNMNTWKKSVYSNCCRVPRCTSNNRYPDSKKIYKAIWNAWGDTFDSLEKELNNNPAYKKLPRISIDSNCISLCSDYILWLSHQLNIDGVVTPSEVYEEIDKLMVSYKGDMKNNTNHDDVGKEN